MKNNQPHQSQRGYFAYELHKFMQTDPDIWVVTGDLGYGMWDSIRNDFPERFLNVGAAEQVMMGVGVGLALEGKKPFIYSITTFLLYRPFETIRNYVNHEKIAVRLVGSGRDKDYAHDGISHWSSDVPKLFDSSNGLLANIETLWPQEKKEIPKMVKQMVEENKPWFISLRR